MAAVEPQPAPDTTLDVIRAARADLDQAAVKAALTKDQAGYLLAASSAGLAAFEVGIDAMTRPMSAELQDRIVAVYERQARLERQERVALARAGGWKARRKLTLIWTGTALVLLCVGAGLFNAGWSRGAVARVAELCQGNAVRDQDGGRVCGFWLVLPVQKGPAGR